MIFPHSKQLLLCLLVILGSLLFPGLPAVQAQSEPVGAIWSSTINISQSPGESADPALTADQTGMVHLFWVENLEATSDDNRHGDTLVYRRWDGVTWSPMVDVLVSPDREEIWQPVVATDPFGMLHIIWASFGGRLYYSHAPIADAQSPWAWSVPTVLASGMPTLALPAALAIDELGALHVIYTTPDIGNEVMYIRSDDGGLSWSREVSLSADMPAVGSDRPVSGGVTLTADATGGLHAGWSIFNREGFGVAVYYVQSRDSGNSWSTPFVVGEKAEDDYEADWLNIATVGDQQIFLVWTGIGRPPGRLYRYSTDGGATWSPVTPFMEGLVGETESPRMVVDSIGTAHLLTPARAVAGFNTTGSGTRYLFWTGRDWSPQFLIPGIDGNLTYGGLRHTATIRLGNEILDAFYDERKGGGEIILSHGTIPIPPQIPAPFLIRERIHATSTPRPDTTSPRSESTTTAAESNYLLANLDKSEPYAHAETAIQVLVIATVPSALLVVAALVTVLHRSRRR